VTRFATDRKALDFIAGRISAEAEREGAPLSVTERKMLYFSETDWTLPDMVEVSAQFDRDYDQEAYEGKIGALVRTIVASHHGNNLEEEELWDAALAKLSDGDHYILVLTQCGRAKVHSFLPTLGANRVRPPYDRLKLWLTAFAIVFGGLGCVALWHWLTGPR
jgi:hypothetical protein